MSEPLFLPISQDTAGMLDATRDTWRTCHAMGVSAVAAGAGAERGLSMLRLLCRARGIDVNSHAVPSPDPDTSQEQRRQQRPFKYARQDQPEDNRARTACGALQSNVRRSVTAAAAGDSDEGQSDGEGDEEGESEECVEGSEEGVEESEEGDEESEEGVEEGVEDKTIGQYATQDHYYDDDGDTEREGGTDGSEDGSEGEAETGEREQQPAEGSSEGDDIDADEAARLKAEWAQTDNEARMKELQAAMGVKHLNLRRARGCDDKADHAAHLPSAGVHIRILADEWNTRVVTVDEGCSLRLAPRSRTRAAKLANATLAGERGDRKPTGGMEPSPVGRAAHTFAKSALDYFTGDATAPPNVYRFGTTFQRLHGKSLHARFAGMARPYRDGLVEGILHFWDEFSALTEEQFDRALHLIVENGSKGPWHSKDNASKIRARQNGEKEREAPRKVRKRKRPAAKGGEKEGGGPKKRRRKS